MKREEQLSSMLKMAISGAGKKQAQVAAELEVTPATFSAFINGSYAQVIRFLEVMESCGYEIYAKKDGVVLNLSENAEK